MSERYSLARRCNRPGSAESKRLVALLRGKPFRAILESLPGYDNTIPGRAMEIAERPGGPRPARTAALG